MIAVTQPAGGTSSLAGAGSSPSKVGDYIASPVNPSGGTTGAFANGRIAYIWLPIREAITIDRISVNCTIVGAAGSTLRLGIYGNTTGRPGTLLIDGGTVVGDGATGAKEVTVNQALPVGDYWACVQTFNNAGASPTLQCTFHVIGGTFAAAAATFRGGFFNDTAVGALAGTAPAMSDSSNAPIIWVRRSA